MKTRELCLLVSYGGFSHRFLKFTAAVVTDTVKLQMASSAFETASFYCSDSV